MNRFNEIERALIERADAFAEKAHAGQLRKYTDEPYIVHPRAVAEAAERAGFSAEAVAAALLHDVMEDCGVTTHELRMQFGEEVAALVAELTDVSKGSPLNRAARKAMDRKALASVSATAQNLKVLDMADNSPSIVHWDKNFAPLFLREKRDLLKAMTKADPTLVATAESLLKQHIAKLKGEKA